MLAAAEAAEGGPPPLPLRRAWRYQTWGLGRSPDDMDAADLAHMTAALNTYNAARNYRDAKARGASDVDISRQAPGLWQFVVDLERMRDG